MNYGPYSVLMDFGIMSILLIVAQSIRSKVKILQDLYLPASLIAGIIGIFLGKDFLNILPFSDKIGSYAYILSCVLFAGLFIGNKEKTSLKKIWDEAGDTFALNCGMEIGQYGYSIVVGTFLLSIFFPNVHEAFSVLMPSGFSGGFAFAASIGGTVTELTGWQDAAAVAQTFSTIGLLVGVFGGILLINIYCRKGATRFVKSVNEIPREEKTGFLTEKNKTIIGDQTTSPSSMDSLTWHFGLIGTATAIAYILYNLISPFIEISFISLALIMGIILNIILKFINFQHYVDKRVITRLGSSVADYLVGFGIASISVNVVISYLGPLLMFIGLGILHCLFTFFLNRKLYHNFWFERSIFTFGWSSGLVSLAITLLRVVDPEFKSKTLEDYGVASLGITPVEIFIVAFVPIFVSTGYAYLTGFILLGVWAILTFLCWRKYGISKYRDDEIRPSEKIILDQLKTKGE